MFSPYLCKNRQNEEELIDQFQSQRRICSQYIKLASQKLYHLEAQRISQANELLEKISLREKVKDLSEWDCFSTRDSVVFEDQSSINLSNLSGDSRTKIISRRNILGAKNVRMVDNQLSDCLSDIQRSCPSKVTLTMKKLVDQYKKIKGRLQQCQKKYQFIQSREKSMKLKEKLIQDLQEKHMILNKRISDIDNDLQKYKKDCSALKNENKQLNQVVYKKNNEINSEKKIKVYEEIINKSGSKPKQSAVFTSSFDLLGRVVEEKESIVSLRYEQIKCIEAKVESVLFKDQNTCNNCCSLVKRMKQSIIAYKLYLQKQGEQFQKLIDNYKQKLLESQKQNK